MKTEEMKKRAKAAKEKSKKKNIGGAGDGLFYDSKSKKWGFRVSREGKDTRRKGFNTKTEAKQARIEFLANYDEEVAKKDAPSVYTFEDVYNHYMEFGSLDKREGTTTKQESNWRCHIKAAFGDKDINTTTTGEINNYLSQLYIRGDEFNNYSSGYAYGTVEGFLKNFYLFYGYAYRMGWVSREKYFLMCKDEDIRITMPKKQAEDAEDDEIVETYTEEEINRMRERIKDSSLYLSFECGYYLGLRISENFGIMWSDIDFNKKTLTVRRQMLKSGVHRVLVPVKTVKANREIDIPDVLIELLKEHKAKQEENKLKYGTAYKATETVRVRMKKGQDDPLTSGDFVHRMDDGTLLSSDSMKSWTRNFKKDLNIEFKYHNLRHTHASILAALNFPLFKLMDRLGHKKVETTRRYYLGKNETADRIALNLLNTL